MFFNEMRTLVKGILISIILLLGSSCSKRVDDTRPTLVVSVEPLRNILEHIVGNRFRVVTLMPGGDNPETFEPSPSRRIDVEISQACFITELLPFEISLKKTSANSDRFINVSVGIPLIYDTHVHGNEENLHHHRIADPHIWTSVQNNRTIAQNMATAICEIDPAHSAEYQRNIKHYFNYLDSLDNALASKLESSRKSFLVWHPSLSYFARDYGLNQVSVSAEAKELSMKSLSNIIEQARCDSIDIMVFQKEYDNRQAQAIAKEIGANVATISSAGYDWEKELISLTDELAKH